MSSNPSARYWMDVFSHLFVLRIVIFVLKDKNKRKRSQGWRIFKNKKEIGKVRELRDRYSLLITNLQIIVGYPNLIALWLDVEKISANPNTLNNYNVILRGLFSVEDKSPCLTNNCFVSIALQCIGIFVVDLSYKFYFKCSLW